MNSSYLTRFCPHITLNNYKKSLQKVCRFENWLYIRFIKQTKPDIMIPANLKGSDKTVYNVHIRLFKSQGMCVKEAHEQAMKKVESTRKVIADDARYEKSRRRYV